MSELRFDELRGEQVDYAIHRQDRTFLPPPDHCPLCPTRPGAAPTEIPFPAFEIAVFDNRFPAFEAPLGAAEVVAYTDQHEGSLATLAPPRAEDRMGGCAHRPSLLECEAAELRLLAGALQALVRGYDALFDRPFPYVMVVHQAPTTPAPGSDGPADAHLHVEFYPPLRTADKLKYLAGSEQGAGTFISDTLPEESAVALREAIARAA